MRSRAARASIASSISVDVPQGGELLFAIRIRNCLDGEHAGDVCAGSFEARPDRVAEPILCRENQDGGNVGVDRPPEDAHRE